MALIIPPGFAQVTIPFQHALVAREAVITIGVDSSNWGGDYNDMCDRICADFEAAWDSFVDNQVTVGPVRASVGQDGNENLSVEGAYSFVGAATAERAAPNTAALLRKLTARGGRRGRGRVYLPWMLAEANVEETGIIPSGGVTSLNDAAENWLNAMVLDPGSTAPFLLHSTGNTPTGSPDAITAFAADNILGTQRRRLGRR